MTHPAFTAINAFTTDTKQSVPIILITADSLQSWIDTAPATAQAQLKQSDFTAKAGQSKIIYTGEGDIHAILAGINAPAELYDIAALPAQLQNTLSTEALETVTFAIEWPENDTL